MAKLVDARDLKSLALSGVRVRVPPSAPSRHLTGVIKSGTWNARAFAFPLLAIALASCQQRPDNAPVVVSAIGGRLSYPELDKRAPDTTQRLLLDATAQGLVRFDAAGQIEPGLAERWIVVDQGRTYIFRLREAEWSNGAKVTAEEVAIILRRAIAPGSRNALKPFLSAIDDIVAMTEQVIEVRLSRPRPDLLKLFAQPDLAVLRMSPPGGTGPFRVASTAGLGVMLRPAFDPTHSPDDDTVEPGPERNVQLIGETAAVALLRFAHKESDYVAGGTVSDWPMVALAKIAPANIQLDPAAGLFGLAVINRSGLLVSPAGRGAVAEAIDRVALIGAFSPNWGQPVERLLPDKLDSARRQRVIRSDRRATGGDRHTPGARGDARTRRPETDRRGRAV